MQLKVAPASRLLPGAAPVSQHSVFGPVIEATAVEATPVAPSEPSEPTSVSLRGRWHRLASDDDIEVGRLGDAPGWTPVSVPDNYGLEPTLSEHFGPVYYRRRLPAVDAVHTRLVFEAVDYLCDAWLDGVHLGQHEGYFAPFAFDVSGKAKDGSELVVRVQDPFEDLDPNELFIRHPKRVIKGTLKYHDSRPGGLPGKSTPGWTPQLAQSLTTGGITGDVQLVSTGPVRIDAVFVTPTDAEAGKAHVAIVGTRLAGEGPIDLSLELETPGGGKLLAGLRTDPPVGSWRIDREIEIGNPRLWWPRSHADLGAPALYRLAVGATVSGAPSDRKETRFGLRTASVQGDPKRFVMNGRPVFVQAVNYIPRQHFADVDERFYLRDMQLCAEAHVNSLGVHGHVQCRACYDAADQAGQLVFQDFALQWHYDSGEKTNPSFIEEACRQIADMGYTLYNHPSVVYWACHNEPTALFVPGMPKDAEYDFDNQVLDEVLEERMREVDPVRHVHRASGIGDDLHLYDGSLNGGNVYMVRDHETWFVSEYGFWTAGPQSHRWGDLRWPPDEDQMFEWLSRMSFGPWTFNFTGLLEHYPSMDAWRRATEHYGALLAKYQTEWIRIRRGAPFYAYRWHFFADWWGWAGGGLVDVDREPKATYRAFQLASRPVLVCTSLPNTVVRPEEPLEFPIHAVNERRDPVDLTVEWSWHSSRDSLVIGADDEIPNRYSVPIRATPNSMVAMPPGGGLPAPSESSTRLSDGKLEATLEPESSRQIGAVAVKTPPRLEGGTLELRWGSERNWFHVIAADEDWFVGPGAFQVSPDGQERLT